MILRALFAPVLIALRAFARALFGWNWKFLSESVPDLMSGYDDVWEGGTVLIEITIPNFNKHNVLGISAVLESHHGQPIDSLESIMGALSARIACPKFAMLARIGLVRKIIAAAK